MDGTTCVIRPPDWFYPFPLHSPLLCCTSAYHTAWRLGKERTINVLFKYCPVNRCQGPTTIEITFNAFHEDIKALQLPGGQERKLQDTDKLLIIFAYSYYTNKRHAHTSLDLYAEVTRFCAQMRGVADPAKTRLAPARVNIRRQRLSADDVVVLLLYARATTHSRQ